MLSRFSRRYVSPASILLTILFSIELVAAAKVTWLWPDDSAVHTYKQSDIINASWTSDTTMMPLFMFICAVPDSGSPTNVSGWVHSIGTKLVPLDNWAGNDYPLTCHFDFRDGGTGEALNTPSTQFKILDASENEPDLKVWSAGSKSADIQEGGASTSSASTASSTPASTASSSSIPAASAVATPSSFSTHVAEKSSSSHISSGAIAGIVIAALVGGGLMAGLGVFFWFRHRHGRPIPEPIYQHPGYPAASPHQTYTSMAKNGMIAVQEKDAAPEIGSSDQRQIALELDASRQASQYRWDWEGQSGQKP